jgi:DNA-3-methyladenine glycosylase II
VVAPGTGSPQPGRQAVHELTLPAPLDIGASLEGFRRWGDDLIDRWDGERLLRALPLSSDGGASWAAIRAVAVGDRTAPSLAVEVALDDGRLRPAEALAALRATFVAAMPGFAELAAADPVIGALDARYPGLRPVLQPDLFTALVRSISAQQVNLRWAAETRRRLALAFGVRLEVAGEFVFRLDPAVIAGAAVSEIRALQFTTRKAESIVALADEFASGRLGTADLVVLEDDAVIERLTRLRGIGRWSAEWILARTLGRPRVVAGDLGVRKAVARAYLARPIAGEDEIRSATGHWGEAAVVAQALLLRTLVPDGA